MEVVVIIQSISIGSCSLAHYMIYCMNYLGGESSLYRWMPGMRQVIALQRDPIRSRLRLWKKDLRTKINYYQSESREGKAVGEEYGRCFLSSPRSFHCSSQWHKTKAASEGTGSHNQELVSEAFVSLGAQWCQTSHLSQLGSLAEPRVCVDYRSNR